MGSRSAARTPKNTSKQNERIDIEGLESFFLDDHKELLAKGLNLKEAVYYYGDSKNEIREKIRNGEIPAIRIPDVDGPKWCIFPDGVPSALKHLIPPAEQTEQQETVDAEIANPKPSKKMGPSEKVKEAETSKPKGKAKGKQLEASAKPEAGLSATAPAVSSSKAVKKAESAAKNENAIEKSQLPATEISKATPPSNAISAPKEHAAKSLPAEIASRNRELTEIGSPSGLLVSSRSGYGVSGALFVSDIPASSILTDLNPNQEYLSRSTSVEQAEKNPYISIMDKFNLPFVDSDWPPASFMPTNSLANLNFDPASVESEPVVTHSFFISDSTANSFSLPLGSILEALIPTLEFTAAPILESHKETAPKLEKRPTSIVIEGNIADFAAIQTTESENTQLIQAAVPVLPAMPETSFSAFAAIKLDQQPALDQMLHRLEQAALNSMDESTASYNPFVNGSDWLPQVVINEATTVVEIAEQPELLAIPTIASEAPLVFVSEDTALPTIPSVRPVNREEASRKRADAEQVNVAPKFERVADLIQKVNELEKELREAHYKNNYLEARLTGMEDQLKYLSQNDNNTKPWNTYTIIILGLLTALALIVFRLLA